MLEATNATKHFILLILVLPFFMFCNEKKENKKVDEIKAGEQTTKAAAAKIETNRTTTYYLIRHAEKESTDTNNPDPGLNIQGMVRAKNWADYFAPIKLDKIYTTKYMRTKQTASLIAQQKMITPIRYRPRSIYSTDFIKNTKGKNILIVGHSNTIPQLVNKLIEDEKFQDMDDGDHATLFKVTLNGKDKSVETFTIE